LQFVRVLSGRKPRERSSPFVGEHVGDSRAGKTRSNASFATRELVTIRLGDSGVSSVSLDPELTPRHADESGCKGPVTPDRALVLMTGGAGTSSGSFAGIAGFRSNQPTDPDLMICRAAHDANGICLATDAERLRGDPAQTTS
jgi:hypothetical protein